MVMSMPGAALAAFLTLTQPPVTLTPPAPTPPPSATATPADDADDTTSTAVPLRPIDRRMTVDVMIDGAGPFRFIVDSGATRTVVSRRLVNLLRLPSAGTVTLHSVGGQSDVDSVQITSLTLNGLPSKPVIAPVLNEADLGAIGILGIDALANKRVVMDLTTNRMTVEPAPRSRTPSRPDEIVVTARRKYGQLVLADAEAAGLRVYAVVDTGSSVTLGNIALRDKLVRRKRADAEPIDIVDVAGHTIIGHYARIGDIRLGTTHIQDLTIAFSDAHAFVRFGLAEKPSMLLGMDVLRAFRRVAIDFKNRTVTLTAAQEYIG